MFWGLGFRVQVWGEFLTGFGPVLPFAFPLKSSIALVWEFPKIRGTVFWGPYNKDPTI